MTEQEFEFALARLVGKPRYPEHFNRGRRHRRRMKNLKDTKLFNQLVNAAYTYRAKWASKRTYEGDQGNGLFCRLQPWTIKSIRGTGLYIKGAGSRRRRIFKRMSARSFRRKYRRRGDISDGNMARRVALDMEWELI